MKKAAIEEKHDQAKAFEMSDWFLAQLPILYGTVDLICKGETNFEALQGLVSETVLSVFVWEKPGPGESYCG